MKIPLLIAIVSAYYYIYTVYTQGEDDTFPGHKVLFDIMAKYSPKLSSNSYVSLKMPAKKDPIGRENATLVMLVRNEEIKLALSSIRSLEDRFNRNYRYPWVFLNDKPFTQDFIEETSLMTSGHTFYELIPAQDWDTPEAIDKEKMYQNFQDSVKNRVVYGGSHSYRNMCRFNSGFFFRQKKLLEYEWYFRVEPAVEYLCDFQYDPFKFLRENNKIYGFVTTIPEYENTIPTLWPTVEQFIDTNKHDIHPNNSINFLTTNETDINYGVPLLKSKSSYNLCHFWSNFEIGNLNFWRSPEYLRYFDHLDQSGGFYYERWGDAPVHSIGLSLLADKHQIHHFDDLGYYHPPYMACPTSRDMIAHKRCICKVLGPEEKLILEPEDIQVYSCLSRWWRYGSGKRFLNEIDYTFNTWRWNILARMFYPSQTSLPQLRETSLPQA